MTARGNVLHDWHAEVLVIRAFNRFVLEECRQLALGGPDATSPFLRRRTAEDISRCCGGSSGGGSGSGSYNDSWHAQPFAWREDVALHMYCSEAPCGDASMELTMAAQADASPWDVPAPPTPLPLPLPPPSSSSPLPGRAFFSLLGAVRRKPARGDAPPTLSKSCSDKLALRQCTSLLAATTALLVSPGGAYLRTMVLPTSQFSAAGCRRAFSGGGAEGEEEEGEEDSRDRERGREAGEGRGGRMRPLTNRRWAGGYAFRPFEVRTTDLEFAFSRREVARRAAAATSTTTENKNDTKKGRTAASNLAVAWTAAPTPIRPPTHPPIFAVLSPRGGGREEATLGGTLQGHRRRLSDAGDDARGASFTSRRQLWGLAAEVAAAVAAVTSITTTTIEIQHALAGGFSGADANADADTSVSGVEREGRTYGEVKGCGLLTPRRRVKEEVWAAALKGWARNEGDDGFSL
ncbi:hypothetical protein SLS62_001496 [Diatrype stigma]|uniref:A to I editase domain-containing protein n=1 Tax=Diatrype stigma TaxID=117547 RepID=A0AAN9V8S7_9PEZI